MGVALRITGFSGVVPRRGGRLLDQNQAQAAVNCRLTSGYIGRLRSGLLTVSPPLTGIRSFYKLSSGGLDYYPVWARDVDVARAPIAGDTSGRFYYTGDNEPRVSNLAMAIAATPYPGTFFVLGVSPPITLPTIAVGGGVSTTTDTRAYVYTFVTPWGEESAPSPASALTAGKIDDTWTISNMDVAPLNAFVVTGAAWAAGVATLTVASTFGARVGETFTAAGMNPAGFDAVGVKATAVDATHVSYALAANPGAFVAGGTITRVAPHNTTGMMKRIYRTVTAASGITEYRFVKEVTVATTNTTEALTTTGEALPSSGWLMPPADMIDITSMPNGMMAGISGNQVCFCVPYKPYAWPSAYRQALDFNGVSLGAFGNTLVATTEANPYLLTGTDPSTISQVKLDQPWPCVSKRGTVELGFGVGYPTDYGYALIGTGGAVLVTDGLYTEVDWKALNPSTMIAAQYAGRLMISYDVDSANKLMLIIDKAEFASVTVANVQADALYRDLITGKLYYVSDDDIFEWDANEGVPLSADWFSREFVFPAPINLGAAKIDADFSQTPAQIAAAQSASAAAQAANQALITALTTGGSLNGYSVGMLLVNGSLIKPLPSVVWDSLLFSLYIDGALKFSKSLSDAKAFRLPAGYKADNAAFRTSGNVIVKAIVAAETMKGLARA